MAGLCNFTPRELQILQLIVAGKTNKEIGQELFISKKTVEFHLDHIYAKIGTRTRILAGIWAVQQGLHAGARINPS